MEPGHYPDYGKNVLSDSARNMDWLKFSELVCIKCKHVGLERVKFVKVIDNKTKSGYRTVFIVPLTGFCTVCGTVHQWDNKNYGGITE